MFLADLFLVFDVGEEVDAVVVELLDASAEVVPQSQEDFAEVAQAADKKSVMNVQFVETTRQLQPVPINGTTLLIASTAFLFI